MDDLATAPGGDATLPAAPETPALPPPTLHLDGDHAAMLGDNIQVGNEGTAVLHYRIKSHSAPSSGGDRIDGPFSDKGSISLEVLDLTPQDQGAGSPGEGTQGEPETQGDEGDEGEAPANGGDKEESLPSPGTGDTPVDEGDDMQEEKVLGYKRPKSKKKGADTSSKSLRDY